MMAVRGLLARVRSLKRAERHLLWLRANLGEHSITIRPERELIVQREQWALAAGDAVARISERVGAIGGDATS